MFGNLFNKHNLNFSLVSKRYNEPPLIIESHAIFSFEISSQLFKIISTCSIKISYISCLFNEEDCFYILLYYFSRVIFREYIRIMK